jgi:hypothetical protein
VLHYIKLSTNKKIGHHMNLHVSNTIGRKTLVYAWIKNIPEFWMIHVNPEGKPRLQDEQG